MRRRFRRSFDALPEIVEFTDEFFVRQAIDGKHRFAVDFAVEEIFTNMVKYQSGNANDVLIELDKVGNDLRIILTDFDVAPFDPTRAEEVRSDLPLEERKVGGLGLQLTKKMMDSVDYEYGDRTSRITLTKSLR